MLCSTKNHNILHKNLIEQQLYYIPPYSGYLSGLRRYIIIIITTVKPFYGTTTRGSGLNRLIKMKNKWSEIVKKIDAVKWPSNDEIHSSLSLGKEMVERIIRKLSSANLDITSDEQILMHDVHPHNTFVNAEKCVLIYDYDWLGKWSHKLTLAFATHRFTREFIRRQASAEITAHEEIAITAINLFVDIYLKYGPSMDDSESYKSEIGLWIAYANLQKLISISLRWADGRPDPLHRSQDRVTGEVRKFIRFLRESEFYPGDDEATQRYNL